ncbi:hypothetical protein MHY87_06470 [Microvirga sp. ACRRW]|uniref:hypothetical protein n=1 Tax=Microvirga sp. ACRRW TaxID=2918205 RepID=UPI001EF5C9E9|nr:hypothetical protein [Microvirga sp. ACRRW]MCG7392546.1 hypothetical protein [Microvirga sp. ACRRW]
MLAWATIVASIIGALFYFADPATFARSIAELVAVIALFALVCAAEVFSEPKG